MVKINPFNPNAVVIPSLFAGRAIMVLNILRKLEQVKRGMSSSFIFTGERGIGKTALAKFIKHLSMEADENYGNLKFMTSYYAVEKGQDFEYVLQTSLNSLTDQLPNAALKRLAERVGSIFKNGKFSFGAFLIEVDAAKKENKQHLKDQAVSIFTNMLKGIDEAEGHEKYNGILIIIDEIHNLENIEGIAMFLRNIATTLDVNELGRVSFLIIGYPEAIESFFNSDPSAKRHFDQYSLECMPVSEAKEVLLKGFKEANIGYIEKEIDKLILYTGGYPHSIQVLGHNLVELDSDNYIDEEDCKKALAMTALELQKKDFSNLYNFNKKETTEEMILNLMALSTTLLNKGDLTELLKGKNVYRSIKNLKGIGAIKEIPATGQLQLNSLLFRNAILMHIIPQMESVPYLKEFYTKMVETKVLEHKE